jgi:hypothetical protein
MAAGDPEMSGSLDGKRAKVVSADDYALIITINKEGIAELWSTTITRAAAARYLRTLADTYAAHITEDGEADEQPDSSGR